MKDEIREIFELYEKQASSPELRELIKDLKELYFEKEEYKSRCEKAIELIKKDREKNYDTLEKKAFYCNKTDKLLNILQGEDKE